MRDELDILIARYLDGTATPAEIEQLDDHLARDPAAGHELYQAAYYDALLRDALAPVARPGTLDDAEELATPAVAGTIRPAASGNGHVAATRTPTRPNRFRLRPTAWTGWAAAACVLVGAVVGWRVLRPAQVDQPFASKSIIPPAEARVVVAVGSGVMVDGSGGTRPAAPDTRLAPNDKVRTGAAPAAIALAGEPTRIDLAPQTAVTFAGGAGKQFTLWTGRVDCQVDKQSPDQPLVVMTPQAQVTVVGTRFDVSAARDWTRVRVSHGTVRVMRHTDGATVDVSAGQYVDVAGRDAGPAAWVAPAGARDMGEFWSVKIRPAGIDQ